MAVSTRRRKYSASSPNRRSSNDLSLSAKKKRSTARRAEVILFRRNDATREGPRSFTSTFAWMVGILAISYRLAGDGYPVRAFAAGIIWTLMVFAVVHAPDTPMARPHPAVWRAVHGLGMAYLVLLSGLMLLTPQEARSLVSALSESFGRDGPSLGHTDTGKDCSFEAGPVWKQLTSLWFIAHVGGFFGKMVLFRDFRFVFILSCCFEFVECSLSWLIPEFYECWWDSLFVDVLGANLLGAVLGYAFVKGLKLKPFNLIGDHREIGKSPHGMEIVDALRSNGLDAAVNLFEKFVRFRGNFFFRSPFRLISGLLLIAWAMVSELTTFLIMHAFDLKPGGYICISRLFLVMACGVCAVMEHHDFVEAYERQREAARNQDELPTVRLGRNISLVLFITLAELKLLFSMGRAKCDGVANEEAAPPTWSCGEGVAIPTDVWLPWTLFAAMFLVYSIRRFRLGDAFNSQSWLERFFLAISLCPLAMLLKNWEFAHKN